MKIVSTIAEVRSALDDAARPIGLVPTMGYLHEGHLSLVARARVDCRTVALSIFVNPTQFGPEEDLTRYPRDVPRDLQLCEEAGVDLVFTPEPAEIYPPDFSSHVEVHGLQDRWEGASRPGHFRGVATVVAKLFRIVQPQFAYFGEKDYQQLQIVRRMSTDLCLDVDVVACPIIREADGLALSSRNVYLTTEDRARAATLSAALQEAQRVLASGETDAGKLGAVIAKVVSNAGGVELDYAAIVDPRTLEPIERVANEARALIAARVGGVRLIDNAALIPERA